MSLIYCIVLGRKRLLIHKKNVGNNSIDSFDKVKLFGFSETPVGESTQDKESSFIFNMDAEGYRFLAGVEGEILEAEEMNKEKLSQLEVERLINKYVESKLPKTNMGYESQLSVWKEILILGLMPKEVILEVSGPEFTLYKAFRKHNRSAA